MATLIQRRNSPQGSGGIAETIQAAIAERRKRKSHAAGVEAIIGALDPTSARGQAASRFRGAQINPGQLLQALSLIQEPEAEPVDQVKFFRGDGGEVTIPVPRSIREAGGQQLDQFGRQRIGSSGWSFVPPPPKGAKTKARIYGPEGAETDFEFDEATIAAGPLAQDQKLAERGLAGYTVFKPAEVKTTKGYRTLEDGTVEERDFTVPTWAKTPEDVEQVVQAKGFTTVKSTPPEEEKLTEKDRDVISQARAFGFDQRDPEALDRTRHYLNNRAEAKRELGGFLGKIEEGQLVARDALSAILLNLGNQILDAPSGPLVQKMSPSDAAKFAYEEATKAAAEGKILPPEFLAGQEGKPTKERLLIIPTTLYLIRQGLDSDGVAQYLNMVGITDDDLKGGKFFDSNGQPITTVSNLTSVIAKHGGVFDREKKLITNG